MKETNKPLIIKKKGEDGHKMISVRISDSTLSQIDKLATETNYSRNELINILLKHAIENVIIE